MKKILITLLLIIIAISTVSWAITVTEDDFKASVNKIFQTDVSIEEVYAEGSSSVTLKNSEEKLELTDSSIILTDDEYGAKIDYSLNDNILKITATTNNPSLPGYSENLIGIMDNAYFELVKLCFLVAADVVDIDYSLACTYLNQKIDNVDLDDVVGEVKDNVFYYKATEGEDRHISFIFEIKLEELSKITTADIKESPYYTVTLGNISDSENENTISNNTTNTATTNSTTKNNTTIAIISNTTNTTNTANVISNKINSTNLIDNTQIKENIPQTGSNNFIFNILVFMIFIALVNFGIIVVYNKKIS